MLFAKNPLGGTAMKIIAKEDSLFDGFVRDASEEHVFLRIVLPFIAQE